MLTKSEQSFTWIFTLVVITELLCGHISSLSTLHYITKPLIVLSLLLFFVTKSQPLNKLVRTGTILALVFSLIGDIALLFDDINPNYFIIGLASFLLAHIMYVFVFLKHRDPKKKPYIFIILMLVYAAILFYVLKDGLGDLLIPVVVYMIVILSMSTSAYIRLKESKTGYLFIFIGALLFMLSDSILALNKFYKPFELSSFLIMSTYAFAQYCIVMGILKQHSHLR